MTKEDKIKQIEEILEEITRLMRLHYRALEELKNGTN